MNHDAAPAPPPKIVTADGLTLWTTISSDDAVFTRFFAGYDQAFVLPNEKEDEAGFAQCFALNRGPEYARLSRIYGPYSEVALVAASGDDAVGGANFIAMPVADGVVTANLNYIYIDDAARGHGYLSRLLNGVREAITSIFPAPRALVFIEQNDPMRMSADDYARDSAFTGLDQLDRLRIWAKRGARVVDFAYKQPPLSADQAVDDTLLYSVLGADDRLDACILEAHLRRFFGVSVLKGADLATNAAATEQLAELRTKCASGAEIELLDPSALLARLGRREDIAELWPIPPRDFREALRR